MEAPCYKVLHDRAVPCSFCPMSTIEQGNTVCQERLVERSGKTYEVVHSPLRAADGRIEKLAVFRDITARKETEKKLQEANRELDAFVSTVSHDLRTPLTPIIGYAELLGLRWKDRLDEEGLAMLATIESQGNRMLALLNDLLELARVGHLDVLAEPTDLAEVVSDVLFDLGPLSGRFDIVFQVASLPSLRLSRSLLNQLFENLIGNALRYSGPKGGPIEISGEMRGQKALLQVRDHGPGVPPEERERIFEAFYRGAGQKAIPGTGIGLATVRKISQTYGGRVWVEETPGGGCTFVVEIPQQAQEQP